jgi:hypothetical protein
VSLGLNVLLLAIPNQCAMQFAILGKNEKEKAVRRLRDPHAPPSHRE